MKKVLITGGTGFIGSDLCVQLLKKDLDLVLLTRNPKRYDDLKANNLQYVSWDQDLVHLMQEVDAVIHLAGEPVVGGRWTPKVKQRIYDSRIQSTRTLVEAMKKAEKKPKVF
ncbi:MAG: NAD-dependent epimerase/dehydratase family protein, partial [Bacteroidetes bacterium]|nr:NAD-dependent epimerase/dehydratase family protein [Bacteroidota bacterium]